MVFVYVENLTVLSTYIGYNKYMSLKFKKANTSISQDGFTLIELLVVIAIVGFMSSIVVTVVNDVRIKSRNVKRRTDIEQIRKALELYHSANGSYPSTGGSMNWRGMCSMFNPGGAYTNSGSTGWIPNLAPTYVDRLPNDPLHADPDHCYLYTSNGTDYKFGVYQTVEGGTVDPSDPLYDPLGRPTSYAAYTPGARNW